MSTSELPRPAAQDVVSADIAGPELAAVRAMLDDLLDEVLDAEWAADAAELAAGGYSPVGPPEDEAIALSKQIVEQMRSTRGPELDGSVEAARQVAEARVVEASRLASSLTETARHEAAQLLHGVVPDGAAAPVVPVQVAPSPAAPPPVPAQISWRAPEADLPHWKDDVAPDVAVPTPQPAALGPLPHWSDRPAAQANEQFWREEAEASLARSTALSPLEVLLPSAALLLLLVAVLVLVR